MTLSSVKKTSTLLLCFMAFFHEGNSQTYVAIGIEESIFFEVDQPGKFIPSPSLGGVVELAFRGRMLSVSYSSPELNRTFQDTAYFGEIPILHFGLGRNYFISDDKALLGYMLYFGKSGHGEISQSVGGQKSTVVTNYFTLGLGVSYQYFITPVIALGGNTRFELTTFDLHEGAFNNAHPGLYKMLSMRAFIKYVLPFKVNGKV